MTLQAPLPLLLLLRLPRPVLLARRHITNQSRICVGISVRNGSTGTVQVTFEGQNRRV